MDCSMPGLPAPHHLPEFAHVHVRCIGGALQPSHPLLPSSPCARDVLHHQRFFQWVSCSHQVTRMLELQLQHQSFQWIFRIDFLWDWLIWSPHCPRDSQESSPAPQFEDINSLVLCLLYSPVLRAVCIPWKTITLNIWTFVSRVMSLLFNTLLYLLQVTKYCSFPVCSNLSA